MHEHRTCHKWLLSMNVKFTLLTHASRQPQVTLLNPVAACGAHPKSVAIRRVGSNSDAAEEWLDGCDYVSTAT